MAHEAGTGDSGPGRLGLEGWTGIRPAKEELRRTFKQGKGQVQRSGWETLPRGSSRAEQLEEGIRVGS